MLWASLRCSQPQPGDAAAGRVGNPFSASAGTLRALGPLRRSLRRVALILYYQALSLGEMGLTTALTGLLTAVVPVVYSFITQGSPKSTQIAGFVLAAAAIGLIAYVPTGRPRPLALSLATSPVLALGCFWWFESWQRA